MGQLGQRVRLRAPCKGTAVVYDTAGFRLHPLSILIFPIPLESQLQQQSMPRKQGKKSNFGLCYPCRNAGCPKTFRSIQGQTYHFKSFHRDTNAVHGIGLPVPDHGSPQDDFSTLPNDSRGPSGSPPPPRRHASKQYHPFLNGA